MITQDKADLHRRSCSSIGDLPQIRQSEILMRSLADVPRRLGKTSPQTLRSVCTQVSQVGVFPLPLIELCGESIADGFPAPKRVIPDAKQEIAVALSQKANDVADERRQPVRFLRIHA